jgi:hypothetical protein
MSLTGELSDLSLAELIEFFCNQRKTGRLKVIYPSGSGYFYLEAGAVAHARIGVLRGIEAVYYALTLPNASFTFSPAFEAPEHTINQPWTSVVLEGLRRMDEGITPSQPFPEEGKPRVLEAKPAEHVVEAVGHKDEIVVHSHDLESVPVKTDSDELTEIGVFLPRAENASRFANGPWRLATVLAAVALIVAVIAVPWGWYARSKVGRLANEAKPLPVENTQPSTASAATTETTVAPAQSEAAAPSTNSEAADLAARRQREAHAKDRAKALQTSSTIPNAQPSPAAPSPSLAKSQSSPGAKKVTVQVTYDENGRVTQASGGDATALRVARQKRFPAGKPGSATITIPIN